MKKLRGIFLVVILISFVFVIGNNYKNKNKKVINIDELSKIQFEFIDEHVSEEGINYVCKLKNDSSYIIKQNDIYFEIPIREKNSIRTSGLLIDGKGNRLNIKPNEEIILEFYVPTKVFGKDTSLDPKSPSVKIIGYLNEVKEENLFSKLLGSKWSVGTEQ